MTAGKERDAETGLDYFGARYFSSAQGRFTSPDWSPVPMPIPYARLTDPQTLNLYAYVRNNPLGTADLDGHSGCKGQEALCRAIRDYGIELGTKAYNWAQDAKAKAANAIQQGKKALDLFNGTLGFKATNCAGAGNCMNALGMAGTAVVAAVGSGGASEEGWVEKQLATAGKRIENILISNLTEETLGAALREASGGMKIYQVDGTFFDHVEKVNQALNGLSRQVTHLESVLERSGLSDSQVDSINRLLERAQDAIENAKAAIGK